MSDHKPRLTYSAKTDSIILGYEIGSADTPDGKLTVLASGRTVRFMLAGHDGYVDLDVTDYATDAAEWLARNARTDAKPVPA